jgi:O-antigen/teichoic acid export membrane protein
MLVYGLPLMILESLGLVLRLSDRYLIEAMLGVDELGQYSASYNLTAYLDLILLATLLQAIRPAYMQIWESQTREQTQRFLSRGLHIYSLIGIPFIAIFSITSPYLLSLLAGQKYAAGTVIIPWVAISFWLEGAMIFLTAGLYIFKNTNLLMYCSALATLINLGLNMLFIPRYGITGAAVVTVISYTVFIAAASILSFRHVRFTVSWFAPAVVSVASLLMLAILQQINFNGDLINLIGKGLIGTVPMLVLILSLDREFRHWSGELVARVLSGRQSP